MKNIFFVLLFFPLFIFSQEKIELKIINEKDEKIPSVKVEILSKEGQFLQSLISDENGILFLNNDEENSVIQININDLEYMHYSQFVDFSNAVSPLIIVLKKEKIAAIEEVTLVKKKPVITRKIDRLEFNVENSNISSQNAWEILKQTPGVTLINDDIKIKGFSGILVTINDKKVMISGDELKTLLENTEGSDVKSVEVITNPPAKYEAEGSTVLNIVMKKTKLEGYKGSISNRYIQSKYAKGSLSTSHQYKKGKISTLVNYTRGAGNYLREGTDVVHYVEDATTWTSKMNRKDKSKTQNTLNFNFDYEADSLTSISVNYRGYYNPKTFGVYDVPTEITNQNNMVESSYRTVNDHFWKSINNTVSLQADRKLNTNSTLSWTSYFASNIFDKTQDIQTHLNFKDQEPSFRYFLIHDDQNIQLYSSQLDYGWKNEKWEVESGVKYSLVKTSSILGFSDNEFGELVFRKDKSNVFDYKEYNFAMYASLAYNLGKWNFKTGLRAENTALEGVVSQPYEINKNNYWKIFPTLYVQYSTENKHQFGFSYGKRISRPSYSWLNPAKSYYNMFSYFQGDPKLKATIIHNLNLTYTWSNWNLDLYYRKEIDPSMEISFQVPETNQLVYHYTNIQKGQAFGLDLYKNFEIKPWWNLTFSETLERNANYFFGVDGNLYKNKIIALNSDISTSFTLDKKTDWTLEIGNSFYTGAVQGNMKISSASTTYLVMNKKSTNKKWEASLYFNDIFRSSRDKIVTKYANQDNYFLDYRDTQGISLTLKYNFGNQSLKKSKTIKNADEQDRM